MTQAKKKKSQRLFHTSHRKTLSKKQQFFASIELAKQARALRQLFICDRILAYSPIAGEIDPTKLISNLNAEIYLPRIMNYQRGLMQFFKANTNTANQGNNLSPNTFGINEPNQKQPRLAAHHFDAVLVPLVSFDRKGMRLGMGAGFYDRSFSFRSQTTKIKRPLLVGLAHHSQESISIVSDSWDVSLDAIITDRELILL